MKIIRGRQTNAIKTVIFGVEGVGKTTLAAQFPDPLFIDTEGSTTHMDVARFDKPTSWTMLKQQIQFVKQNKPCKTLVIDTLDWAEQLAIGFICERGGKSDITSFGYGDGFVQLEQEFGRFLNYLTDLSEVGINVVLTAHAKITRFDDPSEMGAYDRYEMKLGNKTTAKTSALTKEWGDMVLFAKYKVLSVATDNQGKKFKGQGGARVIHTTHHPAWDAKNRFDLPDEIPMDFSAIAHVFNVPLSTQSVQQTIPTDQAQSGDWYPGGSPTQPHEESSTTFDPATVPPLEESVDNQFPKDKGIVDYSSPEYIGVSHTLLDLMKVENVTAKEIMDVTHQAYQGAFPQEMEFKNLPRDFINQALFPSWDKALNKIKENRITGGAY